MLILNLGLLVANPRNGFLFVHGGGDSSGR